MYAIYILLGVVIFWVVNNYIDKFFESKIRYKIVCLILFLSMVFIYYFNKSDDYIYHSDNINIIGARVNVEKADANTEENKKLEQEYAELEQEYAELEQEYAELLDRLLHDTAMIVSDSKDGMESKETENSIEIDIEEIKEDINDIKRKLRILTDEIKEFDMKKIEENVDQVNVNLESLDNKIEELDRFEKIILILTGAFIPIVIKLLDIVVEVVKVIFKRWRD